MPSCDDGGNYRPRVSAETFESDPLVNVEPDSLASQIDTRKPDYAHINWWLLKFGSREARES